MLSFHLVYLCPPPSFHHSLLHAPHPPLLSFVTSLFCHLSTSPCSSPQSFSYTIITFMASLFNLNDCFMFEPLISNYFLNSDPDNTQYKSHFHTPPLTVNLNHSFIHAQPLAYPSTVTGLRTNARRSSVPPSSSFFCHSASQSNEYKGTGE